ncbi:Mce family protein MceD [Nocardia nova SH22a]|uniref:Mce family protein MceD n=1 Tax=Nocardia nova SH22a TaxID=1415166 RepID=W5TL33_9NOCA|nr:MlaD family protein [Nocardia nova]AHH19972.1 Mce family protein MceD [Nocardia nova SH22a]
MAAHGRLHRLFGSRGFVSASGALVVCAVIAGVYLVAFHPVRKAESYCALMPDSIGLYEGSHVTMRGITVGTVRGVHPQGTKVRVDFDVDAAHPVLADASATTVSDTVVADRELAILSAGRTSRTWDHGQCITKTLTPKSISRTLDAVAKLSAEVAGPDGAHQDSLSRGIGALDSATEGTGPQLDRIIAKLGTALTSSDAAIGHLAGAIDAMSALSDAIAGHWGDIKSMLQRMGPVLDQVNNELFNETVVIIDGFQRVLPMLNDITTLFSDPIFTVLDAAVPLVRFISAHVGSLQEIVTMTPALTTAFATVVDPKTGQPGLTYAPPRVSLRGPDAERLCAAFNAIAQQGCTDSGHGISQVRLVQLVLGSVGAR